MLYKLCLGRIGLISFVTGFILSTPMFADVTEAQLQEIENQATVAQSISSARLAFKMSIERGKTVFDSEGLDAAAETLEKAKVWHFRSMVLAERDIGISCDESARQSIAGHINYEHQVIFAQAYEYIGSAETQISPNQYVVPAINWTREHISNWPTDDKQDVVNYGMSVYLRAIGGVQVPALIDKSLWQVKRLECLKNLEERFKAQEAS